jgi:hypothetical protein
MYYEMKEKILTSDASGDATHTFTQIFGLLHEVIIIPGASGETPDIQPSASFDIFLDTPAAYGSHRVYSNTALSNSANTFAFPRAQVVKQDASAVTSASNENCEVPILGSLTLTGANLGDTRQVRVLLIIRR